MQLAVPILSSESKPIQQYTSLAAGQSKPKNDKKLNCVRQCIIKFQNHLKILVFILTIVITYSLYQSSKFFPIYKLETRTQSQHQIINTLRWKVLQRKLRPEVIRENKPIVQFMNDAIRYLEKETTQYVDIERYADQFGELPFCVILALTERTENKEKQIINSILKQNYSNFQLKIITDGSNYQRIKDVNIKETVTNIPDHYQSYYQLIKKQCPQYSAIVFVDHHLNFNALSIMNDVYQRHNTWMIYQHHLYQVGPKKVIYNQSIGIISFFQRVFQLIGLNDFQKDNSDYLNQPLSGKSNIGKGYLTLALIELSAQHAFNIQLNKTQITNEESFFLNFDFKENKYYSINLSRTPFQPLDGLNQDFWIDIPMLNQNYFNFLKDDFYNYDRQRQKKRSGFANVGRILKTKQYEQLMYLPLNHSVGLRQLKQVGVQQSIAASETPKQSEQTRFCVTVLSRNNIQNNRYLRVIQSILQQNYSNYHIVFIDDMSTDLNMEKTMEYTKSRKFSSITYVQNKQRKYGTYNIINAAFTFCKAGQVQLLVDGDDELIGRQVFRVFNKAYARNDQFWVIYSNYRNSHYVYGDSGPYPAYYYLHLPLINRRIYGHMLSPIRSWKVQAIRSIPLEAHQVDGQWFDTGYDDALQYPLFEVAGQDRIHYVKQILYLANKQYGDNDDSNEEKVRHRVDLVFKMLEHEPYKRLQFFPDTADKSVSEALGKDQKEGKFVVVQ